MSSPLTYCPNQHTINRQSSQRAVERDQRHRHSNALGGIAERNNIIEPLHNKSLYVITGGPGSGKTTVLQQLIERGFAHADEVARKIIQQQVATGGDALPWANCRRYTDLMLSESIASYNAYFHSSATTFMDRGIPDTACYARLIGTPIAADLDHACRQYRYNERVFIAPPWEEIYTTDTERQQTFKEALATYEQMVKVYSHYGYTLIDLPKLPAAERAEFIVGLI